MKHLTIILLFISLFSQAQNNHVSTGNFVITYNTSQVNFVPNTVSNSQGSFSWYQLTNTSNVELARVYDDGTIFWSAVPASADLKDTLFTNTGTIRSPFTMVTMPTTIGSTRAVQVGDMIIIYSTSTHTLTGTGFGNVQFPLVITQNSNGNTICEIYKGGVVVWKTFQRSWVGVIGTTRLKRVTIN